MRRPKLEVGGGFLLLSAVLLLSEERLAGPFLFACLVHEAGHLAALYALGGRVIRLRLTAGGAELTPAPGLSYPAEAAAVLAGPLAGLLLALAVARLGFYVTAGVSLTLTIFNLLPLRRQDGGRLLGLLLAWRAGPAAACRITETVSRIVGALFLLAGLWALLQGCGIALLAAGVWILACQRPGRSIQ